VGGTCSASNKLLFYFEDYALDTERRELRRGPAMLPIEPQVLDLLVFLVRNRDRVVSKDDLLASVWGGRIVSESTIASRINGARRVIGDNGEQQRLIRTIIGKGVRFVGKTREQQDTHLYDAPLVAPRLSMVVLPFTNLSDDQEQQYFADGITEDLTTDLSRIAHSFVISCNTAFTYRNKPIATKQIGRELGVRYVLEGSVKRSGTRVRINAQLIDAETDAHLWAERFEGGTSDLFALQDEVTSRIANALDIELIAVEAGRPTAHPDALDYIFRGRATPPEIHGKRVSLFEHALALDPHSVDAQSWLAMALTAPVIDGMSDTPAFATTRAEGLVGRALAASPRSALTHYAKGQLLRAQDRYDEAIPEYEMVLAFNRNWVGAISCLGVCRFFAGSIEEAIPLLEQAIRLSPRDPSIGYWYVRIGIAHLVQSRIDNAIDCFKKGLSANPENPRRRALLASAYALKGHTEHAAAELTKARKLSCDDRFSSIARSKVNLPLGVPKVRALLETTLFAGLRKAGMPEK
jgi:TolB-like protein